MNRVASRKNVYMNTCARMYVHVMYMYPRCSMADTCSVSGDEKLDTLSSYGLSLSYCLSTFSRAMQRKMALCQLSRAHFKANFPSAFILN